MTKKIGKWISDAIKNPNIQDITSEFAETAVDSMLEEGFLQSLPIVNIGISGVKTYVSIRDQLALKKIESFLYEISDVPQKQRIEMLNLVNNNQTAASSVGEKLIYILDKCDDTTDAQYVAQLFKAFLEEKISYQDFLRGSRVIQSIFVEDLEYFLDNDELLFDRTTSAEEAPNEEEFPLINVGILGFGYNPISVDDSLEQGMGGSYDISGGDAVVWITTIGKIIKSNLKKLSEVKKRSF